MYQQMIREQLARTGHLGVNPRHVEGWMRSEHGTLDGLSRQQFAAEIAIAVDLIAEAGADMSERVAQSYGIR